MYKLDSVTSGSLGALSLILVSFVQGITCYHSLGHLGFWLPLKKRAFKKHYTFSNFLPKMKWAIVQILTFENSTFYYANPSK